MRFHLIDRVDLMEPNKSVRARKLTSRWEKFWRDDGRGLQMPAALVFEALCQAGTWLVLSSTDFDKRAALMSVDDVIFGGPVRPGDILTIDGTVESIGPEAAVFSGQVTVQGAVVMSAKGVMCVLMAACELEDDDATRRMYSRLASTARTAS